MTNGLNDQFQVFLATDNARTKTLTIYDGVWWGYEAAASVPEPSTWILLASGCGIARRVRPIDVVRTNKERAELGRETARRIEK